MSCPRVSFVCRRYYSSSDHSSGCGSDQSQLVSHRPRLARVRSLAGTCGGRSSLRTQQTSTAAAEMIAVGAYKQSRMAHAASWLRQIRLPNRHTSGSTWTLLLNLESPLESNPIETSAQRGSGPEVRRSPPVQVVQYPPHQCVFYEGEGNGARVSLDGGRTLYPLHAPDGQQRQHGPPPFGSAIRCIIRERDWRFVVVPPGHPVTRSNTRR